MPRSPNQACTILTQSEHVLDIGYASSLHIVHLRVARSQAAEAANALNLAGPLSRTQSNPASLWLGPDSWLLVSTAQSADEIVSRCTDVLGARTFNATDNSDALVALRIVGDSARDLLSSGCGLDFRPHKFPEGTCQTTRFAHIQATISARGQNDFELLCDRTYLDYLKAWMTSATEITLKATN